MRKALLAALIALALLAGCGGTGPSSALPEDVEQGLYVICSGKPRYCAVADARDPHPAWVSATNLDPEAARRFRRLIGRVPASLRPR